MNWLKRNIVALLFLALLSGNAAAQIQVIAQVDSSGDIYVGERFSYQIIIDGDNKAGLVNTSPLARYNPQSTGNRDVSQTSISIINGKTSRTVIKQYVMGYSLVCNQVGQIQLPPVTVTIDGKDYKTNPVMVNIIKPGTTDQLDVETILSQQKCFVGQPIVMTVKFYISADIGDFGFDVPAFTSGDFYVEQPDDTPPQAKEYNLGNGIVVSVSQYRTTHKGKESILLSFSKILIPKHSGEIMISPTSVSADVAVGTTRSRDSFFEGFFGSRKEYKRFIVSSKPLNLTVLPLPDQGRPTEFYGLTGQYTISASAVPTKVSVGDPITLTIRVGGGKYLKPVQWPDLQQIPEFADNFKIPLEKASPVIENGYKVFTQTIRANNDKITEIPSIPLAYFNADTGRYDIAQTEPIKLEVSPTKILTNADLEGRDFDFAPVNKEVEAIRKGLSANYEDLDALVNQTFSPLVAAFSMPYLSIWGGPLILLIISSITKIVTYTTPEKIAAKRRRTSAGKAVGQLKKIASCSAGQRYELLASIMKQYIGDRFDKTAGSLTSDDCFEVVLEETKDNRSAEQYRQIIADCEAARYASTAGDLESLKIEDVVKLIKTIEKKSGK
ncbi:MAG: BatD family protein [Sedimentisphaerales bacterium]|nr:BatD family protein [Sedimentisphaerales bacterium]